MSLANPGLLSGLRSAFRLLTINNAPATIAVQTRNYPARKGTRERKRKQQILYLKEKLAKVAKLKKKGTLKKADAPKVTIASVKMNFTEYDKPVSNHRIWYGYLHPWKVYSFQEAIECHRQTHHPTMYNLPTEEVEVFVEMKRITRKKVTENVPRVMHIPHKYKVHPERAVVAFMKSSQGIPTELLEGVLYGGRQLIKEFESGTYKIKDFDYVVAESGMSSDLLVIRGILKTMYPNVKAGTLADDIKYLLEKYKYGTSCVTQKFALQDEEYVLGKFPIGTLDMDVNQLEENMAAVLKEIIRSRSNQHALTRVRILCAPSTEHLKIDIEKYIEKGLPEIQKKVLEEEENNEADVQSAVIGTV